MLGVSLQMDPEVEIQRDEKSISALRKNCATLVLVEFLTSTKSSKSLGLF